MKKGKIFFISTFSFLENALPYLEYIISEIWKKSNKFLLNKMAELEKMEKERAGKMAVRSFFTAGLLQFVKILLLPEGHRLRLEYGCGMPSENRLRKE